MCATAARRCEMSQRSFRRQVGQFAIAGFDGHALPDDLRRLAQEFDLGGVILFARNVDSPEQVAELAREVGALRRDWPLWVSVDQEGGRVARLRDPFTEWPPMQVLGRSGDAVLARRFAAALAAELDAVGVTLDYAPVLDIHSNPKNPVIGDRALSDDPDVVARLGVAIIETLQSRGIAACGKHFPGHGDAGQDSHHELPVLDLDPALLRERELAPFRAAIAADVALVMTGHVLVPSLDAESPATLSRRIVHDLLRDELGYQGLVATDDLEMKAIAGTYGIEEAAVAAVGATVDLLLLCGTDVTRQAAALEALIHAAESGDLSMRELEAALGRQRRAKERYLAGRRSSDADGRLLERIGLADAQAVAAEMARHA